MGLRQLGYLLDKIENYPDKIDKILEICKDAQLLYQVASEEASNKNLKEMYEGKLERLKKLMEKRSEEYNMDIFEIHEFWKEIKNRSWRDKIRLDGKEIRKTDISKFVLEKYNNIRYDIVKAGFRDLKIGGSGIQPEKEKIVGNKDGV